MALLSFDHVSLHYGDHVAVDDVSLVVQPRTFYAIVGPNGSGKSSLLRLACGWRRPTHGRVTIDGRDVARMQPLERARAVGGMIGVEHAVFPYAVRESVSMGRYPWRGSNDSATHIDDVLTRTGLTALAQRSVTTLSAGERQRVGIARALAQSPRVYLLDEPTSHLDVGQGARMAAVVRDDMVAREGAVLAVFHDVNLAAAMADHVVLMHHGRVLAFGSPREVLTQSRLEQVFDVSLHVVTSDEEGRMWVIPSMPARAGSEPAESTP